MKPLAIYALEVLACSGVLLAAYAILLDRRVRFGWCRAYLLASTLLAAVIPLLRIPVWPGEVVEVAPTVALPATEWTAEVVEEAAPAVTPETVCLAVYLIGVGLVAGVMLWQVVRIRRLRRGAAITRTERFTLVRTPQRIASFSFFRSIYVWDQIPADETASRDAADKKVSLTVLQNGKPLPGAIVLISGSNVGTVTGKEGTAQISAAPGNELTISYVGFETQKIRVSDKSGAESHVIALKAEDNNLDAVSVTPGDNKTAAGNENASMRKASLTINLTDADGRIAGVAVGAAVVISGTKKGVVADAAGHARIEAPEGAVLKISYPDYRPASVEVGDQSDYVVLLSPESDRTNRKSSPDSSGKPGPIFVVDGVEQASIDDIDPNTIERISVLKNQSSIAVYGSRGKNGVIVVTTKGAGKPATDEVVFNEKTGSVEITSASTEDMPFLIAEKMPLFQGGNLNAFRTWVQEHLQYPAEAVKRNIQGRVVVTFTIEKDGSVSNIQILQSPGKLLADEARRVIASSPAGAWTPGEQRGEKVSVKYTLPVDFRTKTEKTTDEAAFDEKTGTVKTASAPAEDSPFLIAEVMPSFRGGDITAFRNWIQMHIKYPAEALKAKLYGRVVASFVIEKDGSVSDIQILQSPGKPLADEARRVIGDAPADAWTPGRQRGQAVRVKLTVPVDFRIQGADGKTSERTEKPKGSLDEIVVVGFGAPEK